MNRYRCSKCPYVYDPRRGDPDGGIPPGTPFDRIPNSWRCPICGATKRDFYPLAPERPQVPAAAEQPAPKTGKMPAPAPRPSTSAPSPAPPPRPPSLLGWTVGSLKRS